MPADRPASGPSRRLIAGVAGVVALLLALPALFVTNRTPSVAPGIYFTPPAWTPGLGAPGPGDLVMACPPDVPLLDTAIARGYIEASDACAAGTMPFLKRIVAVPGQSVRLDTTGLWVDGARVQPAPPTTDSRGRPIQPAYTQVRLGEGALWLGSDIERGFDSRYLGPFGPELVRGRAFLAVPF